MLQPRLDEAASDLRSIFYAPLKQKAYEHFDAFRNRWAKALPFVLGRALYMKALHRGKQKMIKSTPIRLPYCSKGVISPLPILIRQSGGLPGIS
jgi:hypothetical protein